MVAVAYRRWSFTRGSNCKALTGKVLVFWIGSRLWEAVAYGGSTVLEKSQYSWNVEEEFAFCWNSFSGEHKTLP